MESANIHHHLQDQLVGSSSLTIPSSYGVGNNTHAWSTPNSFLNTNGLCSYTNETNLNPREERQQENTLMSSQYSSMAPDLEFHWANTTGSLITSNQDLYLSRIKEEISEHCYLKYTEMLSSCPSSSTDHDLSLKNEQRNLQFNDIGTKLLLNSFSHGDLYSNSFSNGAKNNGRGLSQVFPSVNISNLSQMGLTKPGSLDMNLQALDVLTSSRFSGNFSSSLQNQIGLLRDDYSFGLDHMQQSHHMPSYSSNKALTSSKGAAETKRSSSKMEPKTLQNAPKKSRLEAHTSCPPFKVRKEKLGDRIAALQQLVAPFGKTDTASVLMEATGYIKFLQNQVETLSVPYMKASRNKTNKVIKGGGGDQNESEEPKCNLKSRGLCLVPLSCLSYITDGGSAAVWPPPHFGGAT